MKVAIVKETAPNERRVALVPEAIGKLTAAGHEVLVAGRRRDRRLHPGRRLRRRRREGRRRRRRCTPRPTSSCASRSPRPRRSASSMPGRSSSACCSRSSTRRTPRPWPRAGVTAVSLDTLPRTLSRAQTMDALSSQANVGGYKAVIMAADAYGRYFPLLTTAAGTAKPANVLILGVGVAGLQAIATARRLGAVVKAYDVRAETKEQAESLGAQFLKLESVADATGSGGYARELTDDERRAQQAGAQQAHQRHGRRHHHGPGARPPPAAAGDRGRGARHEGRLGHRGHGRQRAGRQRRAVRAGRHHRDRERRDHHRADQPAGHDARRRQRLLRPQHQRAADALHQGREDDVRLRRRDHRRHGHHARRQGRAPGHGRAPGAGAGRCRHERRDQPPRLARHLRAGRPGRLRGHQQGPRDAAHAAHVGRQLHPRHRAHRRHDHRRHGDRPARLPPGLHRGRLRRHERGRRLRGHRPHAADVPEAAHARPRPTPERRPRPMSQETLDTIVILVGAAGGQRLRHRPALHEQPGHGAHRATASPRPA